MIDSATRYLAACLVFSKQDEIGENIYHMWISYVDALKKFLCDNGREFWMKNIGEMNEKLNIETASTAGESSFSYEIMEQHNQILAEAFYKVIADVKCEPKIALAWTVSAKNT